MKRRALGDSIMGLSTIAYLKKIFPESHITYALPSWIIPLYKNVQTSVDDYMNVDLKALKDYYNLVRSLSSKFDFIFELHQSGRTRKFFKVMSFFTQTPYGFHNHHKKPHKRKPAIQRDLDGIFSFLKEKKYITYDSKAPSYLDYPPCIKMKELITPDSFKIILGVSATRSTKCWPLSYFKNLCEELLKKDTRYEFLIPLSSNDFDKKLKQEIENLQFPESAKVVQVSLEDLPLQIGQAGCYIGNDTGLKHLCVALGIPTYTFFGPEEPLEWHPYDQKKHKFFFLEPLECRTRISHYCTLTECDSMLCLNSFTAKDVLHQIFP